MNIDSIPSLFDFIEKRKVAKAILTFLNIALLAMLTHYCYVWTMGKYTLFNQPNEIIADYILTGKFLVPFIMFVLIWLITSFLGTIIINYYVSWILKFTNPLKKAVLEKESFIKINWLRRLTEVLSQDRLSRNAAWNNDLGRITRDCVNGQLFIHSALMISVRFVICVIIATCAQKGDFPVVFALFTGVIVFIAFYASRLFYLFFEVMPFFVERYQEAARDIREENKTI